jgi:hypothetical protein
MELAGMLKICSERKAPWRGRTGGKQYSKVWLLKMKIQYPIDIIYTFANKVE